MASTMELVTDSVADISKLEAEKNAPKTFKTMTMKERWSYTKSLITVEPLIASYLMATVFCTPALQALEIEKACRVNHGYNDTICDAILNGLNQNYSNETDSIQISIANMHSWQQPVNSILPLILVLFLGSYSDRHKIRKPFLIMPVLGEFFAVAGCMLCVVFMDTWPLEAQGFAQTVLPSFFGGPTMLIMAVFAYIADVSTIEMRTLRVGIVQIVLSVCTPIVQSVSGILYSHLGYNSILGIGAVLFLFGLLYTIFFVKEPKTPDMNKDISFLADVFNPIHVVETFSILYKQRPGNKRIQILLVLFLFFIYNVVVVGEGSITFLYIQKIFQWTVVDFSFLQTVNTLIHLVGNAVGLSIFAKFFNLHDLIIIIMAFLDKCVTNLIFALTTQSSGLYIASVVSIVMGLAPIAIRSMATKTVSENDIGKAQSLFGICEAIAQAATIPFYNMIYIQTIESFPSAHFYVGILLYVFGSVVAGGMYIRDRIRKPKQNAENGKPEGGKTENGNTEKVPMDDLVTRI